MSPKKQPDTGGKYGRLVGTQNLPSTMAKVTAWCYLCARRNRDPYHTWAEHLEAEKEEIP